MTITASEQRAAVDQFALGIKYANGQGMKKDPKEGLKWITSAANQGLASAQFNLGIR